MSVAFLHPQLQVLRRVRSAEGEVEHCEKLARRMWNGETEFDLIQAVWCGGLEAWTTGEALVLLTTQNHPKGRELFIYGMSGKGILKNGAAIMADLKALARHYGCTMLGGEGLPKGWRRVAAGHGFTEVAVRYLMEID